jgi:hypothetical protein
MEIRVAFVIGNLIGRDFQVISSGR